MSCGTQADALLHAYLDGELDAVRSVEVERHLSQCARCSATLESHRALRSSLADPSLYFEAPEHLEERVRAALSKAARPAKRSPVFGWRALAAAASLAALAVLTGVLVATPRGPSREALLDQELVGAHVRSLMADHLTDVPSSDQHTVKPWFNGRVDFSPEVRDLADDGFPLVGGRLDYIDGHGAAALVYQRRKHVVNVFLWPTPDGVGAGAEEAALRGYNVIRWRRAGTSYAAVSDLNPTELRELVRDLQR